MGANPAHLGRVRLFILSLNCLNCGFSRIRPCTRQKRDQEIALTSTPQIHLVHVPYPRHPRIQD